MCLEYFDEVGLEHPVSPANATIAPPSSPCHPTSSIFIDAHLEGLTETQAHHGTEKETTKRGQSRMTIDLLPDVALLEIFDAYIHEEDAFRRDRIEAWQTLVHVCRKWRNVVFGSPRRLNLRLHCKASTPVREMLDIWPPLPIIIVVYNADEWDKGNIISAFEHNDRICQLLLFDISRSERRKALAALQKPFPALTYLHFAFMDEAAPVIPTSFLGGSAPCLQALFLDRIPFPGLPKLLLSATHLVDLSLRNIPHSGYISPEAMVTCLSVLTRLESLHIGFRSPRSRPDRRTQRLPPRIRTLPVFTELWFKGVSEYLEDLVARIDAPQLDNLKIIFLHRLIFDCPQLTQFISRTPKLKAHDEAHVDFFEWDVRVIFPQPFDGRLELRISCLRSDWQLSSAAHVCSSSFTQTLIPTVERLYIRSGLGGPDWQEDIESGQWLELFRPFTAMKKLHISSDFTSRIAPALKEFVGDGVIEVLPALQTLFLEGPLLSGPAQEAIEQFVAARQLAGHPIAVSHWEEDWEGSSTV